MIVTLINLLAKDIESIVNGRARTRTSSFNEPISNAPQQEIEITINHRSDIWQRLSKGEYIRNYNFDLIVAVKDLRTETSIQNFVDQLAYGLLGASRQTCEYVIDKIDNNGIDDQSIWRYTIKIHLILNANKNTPDLCDWKDEAFKFDSVTITVRPSYTIPLV